MKIETVLLRERIYNALLWTPGKGDAPKSITGGHVLMISGAHDEVSFLSSDGYVAVVAGPLQEAGQWKTVRGEDLRKQAQGWLKEYKEEFVDVSWSNGNLFFNDDSILEDQLPLAIWLDIEKLVDRKFHTQPSTEDLALEFADFYVDPRRLSKFSLLEPKGEYPVGFRASYTDDGRGGRVACHLWKCGPDVRGVMAPLTPELIVDFYKDDANDVMW